MGLAQIHVLNIAEKVMNATDAEPHELVARLRADGGRRETLQEYMTDNQRTLSIAGYPSHGRTYLNSDKSIDAEMRIQITDDFESALMAFGDETSWPKEI